MKWIRFYCFYLALKFLLTGCFGDKNTPDYYDEHNYHCFEKKYYPNSKNVSHEIFSFSDDTSHRMFISYYENGAIRSKNFYLDMKKDGPFIAYNENGKVWYEGFYKYGLKDSIHRYYYDNGRPQMTETYKLGVLIRKFSYDTIVPDVY